MISKYHFSKVPIISDLQNKIDSVKKNQVINKCGNKFLQQVRVFDICNERACRVMAYDSSKNVIIVVSSQDSIRKIFFTTGFNSTPVKLQFLNQRFGVSKIKSNFSDEGWFR